MNRDDVNHLIMNLHLQSYAYAHQFIFNKVVLDAACGTCFGSMIYSTGAKSIVSVDKDQEAIDHGKKLKFFCPIEFAVKDLDKDLLPQADICISIETIEHLNGGGFFLKNLRTKLLIFSVPIDMGGGYHKVEFKTPEDAAKHLQNNGWKPVEAFLSNRQYAVNEKGQEYKIVSSTFMGMAERT